MKSVSLFLFTVLRKWTTLTASADDVLFSLEISSEDLASILRRKAWERVRSIRKIFSASDIVSFWLHSMVEKFAVEIDGASRYILASNKKQMCGY